MPSGSASKPYLAAWLKRTRRELAGSGRLTELVLSLSKSSEIDPQILRNRLTRILNGTEDPSFDLLTEVDSFLAQNSQPFRAVDSEPDLFR